MPEVPLIELKNINLDYGDIPALRDINLSLLPGEVHGIVGEHGAGKSSLGKVISGVIRPQSGTLLYKGKHYGNTSLKEVMKLGIQMVYQHTPLIEDFTVIKNLYFAHQPSAFFRRRQLNTIAEEVDTIKKKYGISIDTSARVQDLNLSDKAVVDIIKHVISRPSLLILDEALEKIETKNLGPVIELLHALKDNGMSILFITHRIDDLFEFADRVSIIRNGTVLLSEYVYNIDKINLIRMTYTQINKKKYPGVYSQEFYRLLKYNEAILRKLPINLIVIDTKEHVRLVNEYCKEYFGIDDNANIELTLDQIIDRGSESFRSSMQSALKKRKEEVFYHLPLRIGNREIVTNLRVLPIFDKTSFIGSIIIIEDITEYDKLQKQYVLSEKLASVGLLSAGVAHEINNPLEIMLNQLNYIKLSFQNQELISLIDDVKEEVTFIAKIVRNLLSFTDNRKVEEDNIEINHLINEVIRFVRFSAKKRSVQISVHNARDPLYIKANADEIRQVFLNLLKNSFEAMPGGGKINIKIQFTEINDKRYVEVRHFDTGHGIQTENPDDIFLPFFSTKESNGLNNGLGLSVSYGIVSKYNGIIQAENDPNGGCIFVIRLPLQQPDAKE
ncbi:ATP-binding cassette domain-containing protein [Marispirochaeta aestuarii]|uniref:ATP-binding cassette domain-containing protein n=1 Tax=Marispirochaeta aestuarii TaxID=1963862 RepID=UPI0029C6EC12|nr:ATP-binding cassette domain-containing protein [Marispirochaeta aestuarii]